MERIATRLQELHSFGNPKVSRESSGLNSSLKHLISSISFWEYWCLLKSSVFNQLLDDRSVLEAFQSTSNESGEIEESHFVELLLRAAKIPVDRAYPDAMNAEDRHQAFLQFFNELLKDICIVDDNKYEGTDPEQSMRRRVLAQQFLAVFRQHQRNIASMFLKLRYIPSYIFLQVCQRANNPR